MSTQSRSYIRMADRLINLMPVYGGICVKKLTDVI